MQSINERHVVPNNIGHRGKEVAGLNWTACEEWSGFDVSS